VGGGASADGDGERARAGTRAGSAAARVAQAAPVAQADEAAARSLVAPDVERLHVHALYDAIAPHFSATRHSPWPAVETFVKALPVGSVVLDIGCGNGKYMGLNPGALVIGMDRSEGLLRICADRGYDTLQADAVSLPFTSGCADVVLNIAVLHHISTAARRESLMRELVRLLRPGGTLFVQAWAFEQGPDSRRTFDSQDVFVPWNLSMRYLGGGGASTDAALPQDTTRASTASDDSASGVGSAAHPSGAGGVVAGAEPTPATSATAGLEAAGGVVNAKAGTVLFQRYCHVFKGGELEQLLHAATSSWPATEVARAPEMEVTRAWWDKDNWCIIAHRRR
ncbi:class I SAM-dependent methyltransferase, partial [archaeon]